MQVQDQLQSIHQLFKQEKERNSQLQQCVDELERLRGLEFENRRQKQRIEELETRLKEQAEQKWNNTFTEQATKVLNKEVKQALENIIDLRSLAEEAPKENAQECLRLMGIALGNLASAMNNSQALVARISHKQERSHFT
ncbi:hypothetical protein JYQ62_10645 [Nostoc sp. UHCC 0702]|nr:hypothetical protein JYQ62_10645 [Nostoc sp. UHCC 0702]